jgi:hypothetical protein
MPLAGLCPAALGLLAVLAIGGHANGQQPATTSDYPARELVIATYLWGSEVVGTVGADRASADVDASFSDILDSLNLGLMIAGGARIGRFVGLFDAMWMELESEEDTGTVQLGPITLGPAEIDAELSQGMADLKLGYRVLEPRESLPVAIDLLAGGRYWYVRSEIDADFALLPDRSFDESDDWVDPLLGARVSVALTPRVQLIALGDFGGWDVGSASHSTWQAMGLLGVKLSDAWSLRLGYRAIEIERGLADFELRGPIAGLLYRFW